MKNERKEIQKPIRLIQNYDERQKGKIQETKKQDIR